MAMSHRLCRLSLALSALILVMSGCMLEQTQGSDPIIVVDDAGDTPTDARTRAADSVDEADGVGTDAEIGDDAGEGAGDAGMRDTRRCSNGRTECGDTCVDLATSNQHCGQCGNACPSGAICHEGVCKCPSGEKLCAGECVDITANDDHCGDCDNTCTDPRSCRDKQCQCPSGTSYCAGSCVDTTTNPDHCGACGMSCGSEEVCEQSSCAPKTKVQIVISETNNVRSTQTDCGSEGVKSAAPPLQGNEELHEAAQGHADDMAMNDFVSHTGSDGSDFATRIRRTDFSGQPVAENVAAGRSNAAKTVQQWVDSDGHCKNLMLQRANRIGVGVANNPMSTYEWYWVQVFGKK